jgi:hypothetical protein
MTDLYVTRTKRLASLNPKLVAGYTSNEKNVYFSSVGSLRKIKLVGL